jgi:predicted dinucleotide-binding enzyme
VVVSTIDLLPVPKYQEAKMKIGILGTGNIGGTLGKKWAQAGHTVKFGARDMDSPHVQSLRNTMQGDYSFGSMEEAIDFGEVVVFAVPGSSADALITEFAQELNVKIVIDATNNMGGPEISRAKTFAAKASQARYFRAFNSYGWENFAKPDFGDLQADLFYCGDDDSTATGAVEGLISDVGLRPIRVGGLDKVPVVDSIVQLWFSLAIGQKLGRHTSLKVLTD